MKKVLFVILLLLFSVGLGYRQLTLTKSSQPAKVTKSSAAEVAHSATTSANPLGTSGFKPKSSHAAQASPAHSIPNSAGQPVSRETLPLLEAVLNQPVSIEHGGALRELALAKDELYVRNADGKGRVVTIPSATSASELLGQIEKVQKETGSAPELILYPMGAEKRVSPTH